MLRVTIELVPRGIEEKKDRFAVIEIANDTTGDYYTGNYDIRAEGQVEGDGYESWKPERLEGFSRMRGYLALAREALTVLDSAQQAEALLETQHASDQ